MWEAVAPALELTCEPGQLRLAGTLDGQSIDFEVHDAIASLGSAARHDEPSQLIFDEVSVQPGEEGYLELRYRGAVYTGARKPAHALLDLSRMGAGTGRYGNCAGELKSSLLVGDQLRTLRFALRGLRADADCAHPEVSGELSGCYWDAAFD